MQAFYTLVGPTVTRPPNCNPPREPTICVTALYYFCDDAPGVLGGLTDDSISFGKASSLT